MSTKLQSPSFGKEALTSEVSLPPAYEPGQEMELDTLSAVSSTSSLPPQYESITPDTTTSADFCPTLHYQVEASGIPWLRLPVPPKPYPVPVYAVTPTGAIGEKVYDSIRPERRSNSCILYNKELGDVPVCTTNYRFGPGKPPQIRLLNSTSAGFDGASSSKLNKEQPPLSEGEEEFEVQSRGCTTRAVSIRTHLGTFQWRYANKHERRAANADALVVLERIKTVALEGGKQQEQYKRVAQLVRNEEYRSEGTGKSTAGNGGRLMMDLREWADGKGEKKQMETIVVASCIVVLKKEVDRRRLQQAMIIAGGASGGS